MRTKLYMRKINGFRVYRNFKLGGRKLRKVSKLLDTFDKIEPGEYVLLNLRDSRLLRAMVQRRDYGVTQEKHINKKGFYKMTKIGGKINKQKLICDFSQLCTYLGGKNV